MQPTYLPWLGYFELIENCNIFIYLDDVQYVKKSFHNRNKIKTKDGQLFLNVPILTKGRLNQKINETRINNGINWKRKHFKSIEINYCKAAYYNNYINELRKIYMNNCNLVSSETRGAKQPYQNRHPTTLTQLELCAT
mgnify:CR=1 FL=1